MEKKIKLTKEQVLQVKNYLNNKDIDYIDLQFEVLDHIILDVENLLDEKQLAFNEAFDEVKLKWRSSFKNESSALLSIFHYRPSIFINRCLKIYKPYYKRGTLKMILSMFAFALLQKFVFQKVEIANSVLTYLLVFVALIHTWFVLYWYFKIKKTKLKTTYSFLYNTQVISSIIITVAVFFNIFNETIFEFESFDFILLYLLLMTFYQGISFSKKHSEIVSNYKKYQLK